MRLPPGTEVPTDKAHMSWRKQWHSPLFIRAQERELALRTLGIDPRKSSEPSLDEIKEQYKTLAHNCHPDRHAGAAEKARAEAEFKRLGQAFETLRNKTPRSRAFIAIDPFQGIPWYHYARYPPWSLARGPPYAPTGFWCRPRQEAPRVLREPAALTRCPPR